VITLKLANRDFPDITKDQLWDHIEEMPDFKEMIFFLENIKLLSHQQEQRFLIFLITKIDEDDVLVFIYFLLTYGSMCISIKKRNSREIMSIL
jgi:hypothetical protein